MVRLARSSIKSGEGAEMDIRKEDGDGQKGMRANKEQRKPTERQRKADRKKRREEQEQKRVKKGLEDWEINSCISAARQIYKKGGYGCTFEDHFQDACLLALTPRGRREPRNGAEFYWKIYYGLIDKFRARTKSRTLKRNNLHIRIYSLDEPTNKNNTASIRARSILNFIEKRQAEEWTHEHDDRPLPYEVNGKRKYISESDLKDLIERQLRIQRQTTRDLYDFVYKQGMTYEEAGEHIGKSAQTVLNILKKLREDIKRAILSLEDSEE
ncbi:MAG: hypothetical protein IJU03_10215 [Thermoguttaceae bacterium]|nr:hypothetical protein [Thermoguttaceae bacterium]